jgi:ribosomal RNA-processing protein 17
VLDEDDSNHEWSGIETDATPREQEAEYSDEEHLATVTVVEDFDLGSLMYGPERTVAPGVNTESPEPVDATKAAKRTATSIPVAKKASTKASANAKKFKYQTAAARKADKRKQRARHAEKAERAGGKQHRKAGKRR